MKEKYAKQLFHFIFQILLLIKLLVPICIDYKEHTVQQRDFSKETTVELHIRMK